MLRITDTHELSGWRPVAMDMPLEHVAHCPCCGVQPEPIAGIYCGQVVVVSQCQSCGWLGYATRPRQEWFDQFYASDWDGEGQMAQVDLSRCATHPIATIVPQLAKPGASVCDVGCGFGVALYQLRKLGYKVSGVEKCIHRGFIAIEHGLFVSPQLDDIGKFDVITAHHVLEHSVDPNAFVAEIAEHQNEGGQLYISVPNQIGEPSMGCLLFLPHLHSFTFQSLCVLANRHGYILHGYDVNGFNLELVFVKGSGRKTIWQQLNNAADKLSRATHANGQGPLLSWCGNLSDAWFTDEARFTGWRETQWKPRAVYAERVKGPGRFLVELEVPCLFVK